MFKAKKLIVAFMLITAILCQLCTASFAAGVSDAISGDYVLRINSYTKDFTGATTFEEGIDSSNLVRAVTAANSEYSVVSDASHGEYGKINGTGKTTFRQYTGVTSGNGIVVVKFDYKFSAFNHSITISPSVTGTRNGASSGFPMITMNAAKRLTLGGQSISKVISVDTWYTFALVYDFDKDIASLYLNDEFIFSRQYEVLSSIGNIATVFQPTTACSMYIDNCTSDHYVKKPALSSANVQSDGTIAVIANKDIDDSTVNAESVSLYIGNQSVECSSIEVSEGNKVVITPKTPLVSAVEYIVRISADVKDTDGLGFIDDGFADFAFTTDAKDYDVTSVEVETDGSDKVIKAIFENNSDSPRSSIMVAVFKNDEGKIVSCEFSQTVSIPQDGTPTEVSVTAPGNGETNCEVFFVEGWLNPITFKNHTYRLEVE
ncbi:MAG: Ig-like domain-containing protein [Clostridia bacterium]|nr:Ig-like domain-containing protein [Clostridia bacterium]